MGSGIGTSTNSITLGNLSPEVATAFTVWLNHLKQNKPTEYNYMLTFANAFNDAKVAPLSQNGIRQNKLFELFIVKSSPQDDQLLRFAKYLIDINSVRLPSD